MSNLRSKPDYTPMQIESNEKMNYYNAQHRFQMFFVSLIFAILSFLLAHPSEVLIIWFKIIEILSLFLLLGSGIIILAQLSEFYYIPKYPEKIKCIALIRFINFVNNDVLKSRRIYWLLFIIAMILIVSIRAIIILNKSI